MHILIVEDNKVTQNLLENKLGKFRCAIPHFEALVKKDSTSVTYLKTLAFLYFKNKDDIKLVQELANVLKGKTVGCSRPIAADMKWLPEDHWIGLSGHKVKPKLYIAAGISGQIQHIAGMRDSGIIVAINKDPEALIFKSADYGIVGDLYEVLPKLTTAIKEKMG